MKVKAALQMKSRGMLFIRDVELEEPRADKALVRISASGICHTDIMMQHGSSDHPFLLGHEGSGIIERTGSRGAGFALGDHETTDEGDSIPQEMIPTMIDWYVNGQFPIEKLLRFYPFEDVNEAVMAIRQGEDIKPVLVM